MDGDAVRRPPPVGWSGRFCIGGGDVEAGDLRIRMALCGGAEGDVWPGPDEHELGVGFESLSNAAVDDPRLFRQGHHRAAVQQDVQRPGVVAVDDAATDGPAVCPGFDDGFALESVLHPVGSDDWVPQSAVPLLEPGHGFQRQRRCRFCPPLGIDRASLLLDQRGVHHRVATGSGEQRSDTSRAIRIVEDMHGATVLSPLVQHVVSRENGGWGSCGNRCGPLASTAALVRPHRGARWPGLRGV